MLLTPEKSLCEKKQAIVVSKDPGKPRAHRAVNPKRTYSLRHYRLDGELVKNETCCDFLLVNDSMRKAYLIELKGEHIDDAVEQLEAGERKVRSDLSGYIFYYRIVGSKARTHKINGNKLRRFKEKCGKRLVIKENVLEETLN